MTGLSAKQRAAVVALVSGAGLGDAAAEVGVHRNTVGRWLSEPLFASALIDAHDDALAVVSLGAADDLEYALNVIRRAMSDADVPAAVRVRAATALIDARLRVLDAVAFVRRIEQLETTLKELKNEQ